MTTGTAVYGTVRTVVWEDGGREPSSYPIAHILWFMVIHKKLLLLLSTPFEETQLLSPHQQKLYEHAQALCTVG